MSRIIVLIAISALLAFASGATVGQELERMSDENTGWWWYTNVSAETLGAAVEEHDARLIDLEVSSVSPLRFTASMVRNSGSYASGWWWYFGIDSGRVSELVNELSARVLDLEVYDVGGQLRYAVILVPNTGSQAKAWWWYSGVSFDTLSDLISRNNARLVDLEVIEGSGQRRYVAVMIRNTGADQAAWWWYVGVSASDLSDALASHSARLLDLERMSDGRYAAIAVRPRGEAWWWYYGQSGSGVADRVEITGGRIVDIERYSQGGAIRYAVVLTGNVDNAATTVGQMLASGTDGEFGYYLKRMGGPVISGFHEDQTFYPASTIKALLLLYTISRLASPLELDTSFATYYSVPAESCLDIHPPSHVSSLQPLRWLAQQMMRPSNNQATNTLMEYAGGGSAIAGRGLINNYVHEAIGLSLSTALNHKFGCGGPSNDPANSLTLSDIGTFYERAITGGVLPAPLLAEFHDTMLNETNAFPAALRTVIEEEAAALGKSDLVEPFIDEILFAQKAGNIGTSYISIGGWVELPFAFTTSTSQSSTSSTTSSGRASSAASSSAVVSSSGGAESRVPDFLRHRDRASSTALGASDLPLLSDAYDRRAFVFGVFIDNASTIDEDGDGTPLSIFTLMAELLRDQVRAALSSW